MKRVTPYTLSDVDCNDIFDRLDVNVKRRLLLSDKAVDTFFLDVTSFRDVIQVVARFVDLQTWGRLKRTCTTFNASLADYSGFSNVKKLFRVNREFNAQSYLDWFKNTELRTCKRLFFIHAKRLLIHTYMLLNPTLQQIAGHVLSCTSNYVTIVPPFYNVSVTLSDLASKLSCTNDRSKIDGLSWINFDFLGIRILYPYGYVCDRFSTTVIGNIYCDFRWLQKMFTIDYDSDGMPIFKVKSLTDLTDEGQKEICTIQTTQLQEILK